MKADTSQEGQYRFAIRRPVTIGMLFLTLVVFGWKSYRQLPINLMPDISYPTLTVRTEYEGAAPEDVERFVTRPLEETLSIVGGLVEISSISSPGLSEIILEFTWGTDMNLALQEVRDRLDLFESPRDVTEKPIILRYDPTLDPVMRVALSIPDAALAGSEIHRKQLTALREAAERHIKSDLEAEMGIAQVEVKGGREEEIQVLVDAPRLKNLGYSVDDIATALSQQNINLSGGRLRDGKTEYLVRTLNEYQDIEEIEDTILGTRGGASSTVAGALGGAAGGLSGGGASGQLRVRHVAEVVRGEKDRETIVHINGREAVALDIFKDGDANTVEVCNQLKDVLGFPRQRSASERVFLMLQALQSAPEAGTEGETTADAAALVQQSLERLAKTVKSRLPEGAEFTLISDQSRFIVASIQEVQEAALWGGLMALIVLFFFLRELRSTVVIGIAIPISVIAAFIPMFARGISLNIMSLGGLALGVGMLVDNSIVVLESIFRCREEGDDVVKAAERGANEVSGAVVASTLTTIAVFFPIAFVEGIAGQIFGDLAMTVTFSLLASLLVALYLNPMMVSRTRPKLEAKQDVVWVLRAYREARVEGGRGLVAGLLLAGPKGVKYAWEWVRMSLGETFGPWGEACRKVRREPGIRAIAVWIGRTVLLPLVVVLYAIRVVLKIASSVLTMALFFLAVVLVAMVWLATRLVRLVLWLPLTAFDLSFRLFQRVYAVSLKVALDFSPLVMVAVAVAAVHAGMTARGLGSELIPSLKQGEFGIRMEAPPGTRLEETEGLAREIEAIVRAEEDVESVAVEVGMEGAQAEESRGENIAQFTVLLRDPEETSKHQEEIIDRLRRTIPASPARHVTFTLPSLFSFKTAVEIQIRGDDLGELKKVGRRTLEAVRDIEGLKDPELSMKKGYPEVIIEFDRDLLAARNLSAYEVGQRLNQEVQGYVPTRYSESGEKVDIRVRADQEQLRSLEDLRTVSVKDSAPPVPLSSVADISIREGPSEVRRVDQRRVVVVSGNVEGMALGAVSRIIEERLKTVEKPKDYSFVLGGQNRELRTSFSSLQFALLLAMFLVYVVMACQFESLVQPALVMFSVPLAFVGVIYALVWMNINLSVVVFIGGIILAGIVVNDAIVLVSYINQLRERGMPKREAIMQAGQVRLRPILMTTVTTVLGLVPMVLASGEGAEMRRPLAVTVMAGLSSATVLTLVVIPVVCYLFTARDKT